MIAHPPPPATFREARIRLLRRAAASVVALLLFVAALSDVLASDRPLLCTMGGHLRVFPSLPLPPGGDGSERRAACTTVVRALVAYGPATVDVPPRRLVAPLVDGVHPLGTDREGRDVFARIVHGTRSYWGSALAAAALSVVVGSTLGGMAALWGGSFDSLVGRVVETLAAFPPLVLVLVVQAAVTKPSIGTLFGAIALTRVPEIARLVRAEVMSSLTRDYATAARALGASPWRILRSHIAPNLAEPVLVAATLSIPAIILTEGSVDFLGAAATVQGASWGEMMSEVRTAPRAWWLLVCPLVPMLLLVASHQILGEALRRYWEPRSR